MRSLLERNAHLVHFGRPLHLPQPHVRRFELLLRGGERLLSGGSLCQKKKSNVGV